jgi:hypothetical protein
MKLKIPNLMNIRQALSAMLVVAGASLITMTSEALAGTLFIVLGVFVEMAAITITLSEQDSRKP